MNNMDIERIDKKLDKIFAKVHELELTVERLKMLSSWQAKVYGILGGAIPASVAIAMVLWKK